MKISPISNYKVAKIKKQKNNSISFGGKNEIKSANKSTPLLKFQISMQAKKLQKASQKNKELANQIIEKSQLIKNASVPQSFGPALFIIFKK